MLNQLVLLLHLETFKSCRCVDRGALVLVLSHLETSVFQVERVR